ncbi:MAG TPA: histidine phosphatase family protein [Rhodanobacteraceae bacterium]|nr:histidine phosphatase family protein [Rhodanobacteraceae bacterium]
MKLLLVRAGHTEAGPGTLHGQCDVALAAQGFTAIQSLAASWGGPPPRFLFASDLRRAAQCAQVFASHFALEPLFDERLREINYGRWNGLSLQTVAHEDRAQHEAWRERWVMQPAPGGESFADLLRRTGAWLSALIDSTDESDLVLAVAHEGSIRAMLCHALGLPPQQCRRLRIDRARVSAIDHQAGRFEVSLVNAIRFQGRH